LEGSAQDGHVPEPNAEADLHSGGGDPIGRITGPLEQRPDAGDRHQALGRNRLRRSGRKAIDGADKSVMVQARGRAQ
jgi:hypothetical protein